MICMPYTVMTDRQILYDEKTLFQRKLTEESIFTSKIINLFESVLQNHIKIICKIAM